ncbi:hypothetical protein [Halosimplex sp. J119]
MSWGDLFERANDREVTVEDVRAALSTRRTERTERGGADGDDGEGAEEEP